LIFLNMLTMGIEHYNQPHAVYFLLEVSNAFFTTVFGLGKSTHFPLIWTERNVWSFVRFEVLPWRWRQ
jgi:hypothetical protein